MTGGDTAFPVADRTAVRREATALLATERRAAVGVVALTAVAAAAGAAGPALIGGLVNGFVGDAGAAATTVDRTAVLIVAAAVVQTVVVGLARTTAARLGERVVRVLRERFVDRVLDLPLAVVERAGTGDLMTRSSEDLTVVGVGLRDAVPDVVVSIGQTVVIVAASFWLDPWLGCCVLAGLPALVLAARWYLRRAGPAYLAEGAAKSRIAQELAGTAEGARTVDALGLGPRRVEVIDAAIDASIAARRHTLWLRCVVFGGADVAYVLPPVTVLLGGGLLYAHQVVGLGAVVAASLYAWQLAGPVDRVMARVEELQSTTASFARVIGIGESPGPSGTSAGAAVPGAGVRVAGVRHAYVPGRDVLHGVDLVVAPGERLAVVGPSGAGKSTLGRLIAGIDPPRSGTVTVSGLVVADLEPGERRSRVVMVTQEHHVFIGTLRDNLTLAADDATDADVLAALDAVDAGWVHALPDGLDTVLGAGGTALDAGQEQQIALARVVLADPDTVVLDEATALLDPATARATERSMFAVLRGRTVIAIAHRLQTARDADRVAVLAQGRLIECGPHDELVAAGGPYAALWHSWHGGADRLTR